MTVVALYGGSFNPPHVAHQLVSLLVLETCEVDELWWVPTYRHAFGKDLAPWHHRVEMCKRATARLSAQIQVCEVEAELAEPSKPTGRTLDTLTHLRAKSPEKELRLVIGADILAEAEQWYRWSDVVELAPPIVVARAGFDLGAYGKSALPQVPAISSTEVRARIASGQSATPLVSRAVMDYIAACGLYR